MIGNPRKKEVLIALGANLPSQQSLPEQTLASALDRLVDHGFTDLKSSDFYQTPCFPAGSGPDYVNAAARFVTEMDAPDVLAILHKVEAEFGRERIQRWGQRTLDLDLIAIGDEVHPDVPTYEAWRGLPLKEQTQRAPDQLILPHPRIQDRAFVLVPLADVAPDWRHPILGKTVVEMRDALNAADVREVVPL